jgi:hypothetical protein
VISPHDPNVIVIGGKPGIYKSTYRAKTWENISNGLENTPAYLLINLTTNFLYLEVE